MTDLSHEVCDWRRRLSRMKVTDSDLTKYDWRQWLGGGGAGVYCRSVLKIGRVANFPDVSPTVAYVRFTPWA